jgi:hypothetical protein
MHRIDGANHSSNLFTEGPPGTQITDDWLNDVQENIAQFIVNMGIALSKGNAGQLEAAVAAKIVATPTAVVVGSGGGAPAYGTNWAGAVAPADQARYWKGADGIVRLRGTFRATGATSGASHPFQLPVGFRPTVADQVFDVVATLAGNVERAEVYITTGGNVVVLNGATTTFASGDLFSLDGIAFHPSI